MGSRDRELTKGLKEDKFDVKRTLAADSGPVLQVVLASLPFFALLVYFLFSAYAMQTQGCFDSEQQRSGICDRAVELQDMIVVFMVAAQLWAILSIYIVVYIPKRHRMIQQYLKEGESLIGDVFYEMNTSCGGLRKSHIGQATYPHINQNQFPVTVFVERKVRVLNHYTREKVAILCLPGKPLSGQPKDDLRLDAFASERNKSKLSRIAAIALLWTAFAALSPIYLLMAIGKINVLQGADPTATRLNWVVYGIGVAVVMPIVAFGVNEVVWTRYYGFMTEEGEIKEEKPMMSGGMYLVEEYAPPALVSVMQYADASVID